MEIHHENEFVIQMEMLPAEAIEDDTKLVEITDSKVMAHVNNLVPGLAQVGNAVNNATRAVQAANGEVLYRAVIPAGAKLINSKVEVMNGNSLNIDMTITILRCRLHKKIDTTDLTLKIVIE